MNARILDIHRASGDADLATTLTRLAQLAVAAHRVRTAEAWMPERGQGNAEGANDAPRQDAADSRTDAVGGSRHTEVDA